MNFAKGLSTYVARGDRFEEISCRILESIGFELRRRTLGVGDKGLDLVGSFRWEGDKEEKDLIQVVGVQCKCLDKHETSTVAVDVLRQLVFSVRDHAKTRSSGAATQLGVLVSNSKVSNESWEMFQREEMPLMLVRIREPFETFTDRRGIETLNLNRAANEAHRIFVPKHYSKLLGRAEFRGIERYR